MEDFRISGEAMNQLSDKLDQVKQKLEESHQKVSHLLEQMTAERAWTGESADAFFAYIDLMSQYHGAFLSIDDYQPLEDAQNALKELGDNIDNFYTDFLEYKEMEKIE